MRTWRDKRRRIDRLGAVLGGRHARGDGNEHGEQESEYSQWQSALQMT